MNKGKPETPKEYRDYCRRLQQDDNPNCNAYWMNFIRLVCLVVFFLTTICGLNVWLFYKG